MRRASIHEKYDVGTKERLGKARMAKRSGTSGTGGTSGSASRTGDYGTGETSGIGETSGTGGQAIVRWLYFGNLLLIIR